MIVLFQCTMDHLVLSLLASRLFPFSHFRHCCNDYPYPSFTPSHFWRNALTEVSIRLVSNYPLAFPHNQENTHFIIFYCFNPISNGKMYFWWFSQLLKKRSASSGLLSIFLGQSSLLNCLLSQVPWKWHLKWGFLCDFLRVLCKGLRETG